MSARCRNPGTVAHPSGIDPILPAGDAIPPDILARAEHPFAIGRFHIARKRVIRDPPPQAEQPPKPAIDAVYADLPGIP
jgi:hypothetical protein